jgi:hypothetical protein
MIVNFRVCEISRDTRKLTQIFILIKKKKNFRYDCGLSFLNILSLSRLILFYIF